MRQPSVTVLMTVHNGMPYLKEAVRSILAQDTPDWRLAILDNGSTDGSAAYLEELVSRLGDGPADVRVERLPENIGRTAALNLALDRVESEFTALLDADDLAAPNRLSRQLRAFRERPGLDLVGSDITYMDGNGNTLGTERFPTEHEALCAVLPVKSPFVRSACMFRTDAARAVGGYDRAFPHAPDLALWIAMLARGCRAASIDEPLARIRVHPGQHSGRLSLLRVRAEDTHRLAEAMLAIPGLDKASRQAAHFRGALALWRLGCFRRSCQRAWLAFLEAPTLFPFNPLVWRRWRLERQRRKGRTFR